MREPDAAARATAAAAAPTGRGRAAARAVALILAAVLMCTGGAALVAENTASEGPAQVAVERDLLPVTKRTPPDPAVVEPALVVEASAPQQVTIPSVGIDARVTPYTDSDVQANDGWIDPPQADAASWWTGGGTPASNADNTVYLYGHVSRRPAVFNSLRDAQPGAQVTVQTTNGTLNYTVGQVLEPIAKEDLPSDERVTAAVPGRLVLIGCYREADQGSRPTTHNTVVIAQLTSSTT